MKMNQLALATLAVFAASQAVAAPQYLAGASASSVNVMKAAKNLCVDAGGTFKLFKSNTTTTNLGNQFTGECTTDFTGTTGIDSVRMNVAGGSEGAVTATTAAVSFLAPVQAACTAITGTESLSTFSDANSTLYKCPSAQVNDSHLADGGFLDVEGPVFNAAYNPDDFVVAGFSQVFAVGVNSTLYNALQTAQGLSTACKTDTNVKYTAACQPSISKAQIASLINGDLFNTAKTAGGKFLVGGTTDGTKITYCQRPQSSGTQQSAQMYFLNYAATSALLGGKELVIATGINQTKYSSILNSGSSNVKDCLNSTTDYRFGILSAENNPLAGTDSYRFVKLNGVAAAQGAGATDSNTATALTGEYDFVFETVAYCAGGTCPAFVQATLDNIDVALPVGSSTAGLFLTGVESVYGRGGKASAPYIAR